MDGEGYAKWNWEGASTASSGGRCPALTSTSRVYLIQGDGANSPPFLRERRTATLAAQRICHVATFSARPPGAAATKHRDLLGARW